MSNESLSSDCITCDKFHVSHSAFSHNQSKERIPLEIGLEKKKT